MNLIVDISNRRAMSLIRSTAEVISTHLTGGEYDLLRDRIGSGVGGACEPKHVEQALEVLRRVRSILEDDQFGLSSTGLTTIQDAIMALNTLTLATAAV